MAKWIINPNLDLYSERLAALGERDMEYIEKAIKKGADPVADAVRGEINALPSRGNGMSPYDKAGLAAGLGIAPMRNDGGFINVKVGFHDYDGHPTKAYPYGRPVIMIADAIEHGTSFRTANPFMSRAIRSSRKQAEENIKTEVEKAIKEIMEV